MDFEIEMQRSKIEQIEEWRELARNLPYLSFPAECEVMLIPPFGGALMRFLIRLKAAPDKTISVYFDQFSRLGCMDKPYWEMYPNKDDDCSRYYQGEEEGLMAEIIDTLNFYLAAK